MQLRKDDEIPSITKNIDQNKIMRWAQLSGDFNRLHVDPEYAKKTRFKGTIAHGPMSLAFLNELMMNCLGQGWVNGGRLLEVRFLSPIRPGDQILIGGRVEALYQEGGSSWAECGLSITKADGQVAVTGRAVGPLREERL